MPFLNQQRKPLTCFKNALWSFVGTEDTLLTYRYYSYNLAFSLINIYGTTYETPKKGVTFARQIWKPKFEPLLNQLCSDIHPSIRFDALNSVLTGTIQIDKESSGQRNVPQRRMKPSYSQRARGMPRPRLFRGMPRPRLNSRWDETSQSEK